jgi:hypothetical protein
LGWQGHVLSFDRLRTPSVAKANMKKQTQFLANDQRSFEFIRGLFYAKTVQKLSKTYKNLQEPSRIALIRMIPCPKETNYRVYPRPSGFRLKKRTQFPKG